MDATYRYQLVYTMTHSSFMLGLSIFAAQFPSFLLSLFGGIISDRYNRYKILISYANRFDDTSRVAGSLGNY